MSQSQWVASLQCMSLLQAERTSCPLQSICRMTFARDAAAVTAVAHPACMPSGLKQQSIIVCTNVLALQACCHICVAW